MPAMVCRRALCLAAALVLMTNVACTQSISGSAVRSAPGIDDDSRSPVDVDTVLLAQARMRAITGGGDDLTVIPSMDGKQPVDIDVLADTAPPPCRWYYVETETFGPDVEEFHKTTYQHPPKGALISQGAAGYRDAETARRAFDGLTGRVDLCGATPSGSAFVGDWTASADSLQTRTGGCGRDYRVKSAVMVEVTFCGYPSTVPDIVLSNMVANVPG
ncbi:sensor domain-containing protein [Mycolicibacterium sediminis]